MNHLLDRTFKSNHHNLTFVFIVLSLVWVTLLSLSVCVLDSGQGHLLIGGFKG
jgi:hypothetical protein